MPFVAAAATGSNSGGGVGRSDMIKEPSPSRTRRARGGEGRKGKGGRKASRTSHPPQKTFCLVETWHSRYSAEGYDIGRRAEGLGPHVFLQYIW